MPDEKSPTLISTLYSIWMNRHEVPSQMSGDDEFNKPIMIIGCNIRGIQFKPRPTRRHNKTGLIERKNRTLKTVLERLNNANIRGMKIL